MNEKHKIIQIFPSSLSGELFGLTDEGELYIFIKDDESWKFICDSPYVDEEGMDVEKGEK